MLVAWAALSAVADQPARPALYHRLQAASVEVLVGRVLAGSGCVVDPDGTVLTALHMIPPGDASIEIRLPGGQRLPATWIAADVGHDLALLQLPPREGGYAALSLAAAMPAAGTSVSLFGAPLFRHAVLVPGAVARQGTTFEYVNNNYIEVVHVSGMAAGGFSGGPWVDAQGAVIGVQSATMTTKGFQQGICFAVPVEAVRGLLATRQSPTTPTLGAAVEELWEQPAEYVRSLDAEVQGLVAKKAHAQGPAAAAGIQEGEIITAIGTQPVVLRDELLRAVWQLPAGDPVTLTVRDRQGQNPREVVVRLGGLHRPER